jgi:hypothetical protein
MRCLNIVLGMCVMPETVRHTYKYSEQKRERYSKHFVLLKTCTVVSIEFHKPTTCTFYYALKCSNYTPTCFEPLIGSSSGRATISQITHTSNNMITRFGCSCSKYTS